MRRVAALLLAGAMAVAGGCGGRQAARRGQAEAAVTPVARRLLGMTPAAAQGRFEQPSLVLTDLPDADRFAGRPGPAGARAFTPAGGYRYEWRLNAGGTIADATVYVVWPGTDLTADAYQRVRAWLGLVVPAMSKSDREWFIGERSAGLLEQRPNHEFQADLYGVAWVVERQGDVLRVTAQTPADHPGGATMRVQRDRPFPFTTRQVQSRLKDGINWYMASAGSGEWEGLSVTTGAIGNPRAALNDNGEPLTVLELIGTPHPYKLIAMPPPATAVRHPDSVLSQGHLGVVMRLVAPEATAADAAFARTQLERLQQAPELEAYTWVQYGVRFSVAAEYRDAGAAGKGAYYTFMAESA